MKQTKIIRRFTVDEVDRFWSFVIKGTDNECWVWVGGKRAGPNGYGQFSPKQHEHYGANRVSYTLSVGPIPLGVLVCHRCNTKACVNPSHLYLGDHKVNARDASRDGLLASGQRHGTKTKPQSIHYGSTHWNFASKRPRNEEGRWI